jgi:hypothetical protein
LVVEGVRSRLDAISSHACRIAVEEKTEVGCDNGKEELKVKV